MADIIRLLPDHVANQIAAGEVVQRPASVVKELLENSVDAGATRVVLGVKDAGRTLIQVTDDGKGMSPGDARMSFERHATSKIRVADDLHAVRTKGFRGEALADRAAALLFWFALIAALITAAVLIDRRESGGCRGAAP